MALTRFKDARAGKDGPVSGSLIVMPVQLTEAVTGTSYQWTLDLPAGMGLELVDINVQAVGVAGNPQVTVGSAKAGTQFVAAATLTTNLGSLTLKSTSVAQGGILSIQVANDATGDVAEAISANVVAYVSHPPTALLQDDRGGQAGY